MDGGTQQPVATQVIQTAKLFIKFVEQLNRSCLEKKRGANKTEKKPITRENEPSMPRQSNPEKKVKLDRPKEMLQTAKANPSQMNTGGQQAPRPEEHREDAAKKAAANLYSFKDQKPLENKDIMQMSPFGGIPLYNIFGAHNPLFGDGMAQGLPFYPAMDPITYMNFQQNKHHFPGYFIPPVGMSPDKMHYFNNMAFNKNFMIPPIHPAEIRQPPKQPTQSEKKLFRRASYHVAIAYNIHLQKLNKKSPGDKVDPNELDPTYKARNLKEQKVGEKPSGNHHFSRDLTRSPQILKLDLPSERSQESPYKEPPPAIQMEAAPLPACSPIIIEDDNPAPTASFEPPVLPPFTPPEEQPIPTQPKP